MKLKITQYQEKDTIKKIGSSIHIIHSTLVCVSKGCVSLEIDGKFQVAIECDEFIFLPKNSYISLLNTSPQINFHIIDVQSNILAEIYSALFYIYKKEHLHNKNAYLECLFKETPPLTIYKAKCTEKELMIFSELNERYNKVPLELNYKKTMIFIILLRFISEPGFMADLTNYLKTTTSEIVYKIAIDNLTNKWSLDIMAKTLNISASKLKRDLKKEGVTFTQIISDARYNTALRLIRGKGHTETEIIKTCGITNIKNFKKLLMEFNYHNTSM